MDLLFVYILASREYSWNYQVGSDKLGVAGVHEVHPGGQVKSDNCHSSRYGGCNREMIALHNGNTVVSVIRSESSARKKALQKVFQEQIREEDFYHDQIHDTEPTTIHLKCELNEGNPVNLLNFLNWTLNNFFPIIPRREIALLMTRMIFVENMNAGCSVDAYSGDQTIESSVPDSSMGCFQWRTTIRLKFRWLRLVKWYDSMRRILLSFSYRKWLRMIVSSCGGLHFRSLVISALLAFKASRSTGADLRSIVPVQLIPQRLISSSGTRRWQHQMSSCIFICKLQRVLHVKNVAFVPTCMLIAMHKDEDWLNYSRSI